MLRSAIDDLNLDQFLPMLSVLDQDEHISVIPHSDRDHPMFYWIFRNKDFSQWNSAECSRVLWLSSLPERNIDQVSSYVVHQEKETALKTDRFVLYFFCSSAIRRRSSAVNLIHTLLKQIVYCSPIDKRIPVIRNFLRSLLEQMKAGPDSKTRNPDKECSLDENIKKILNAPVNELFTALCTVLDDQEQRGLSLIVDGLDKVEHQRDECIRGVRAFIEHLQQRVSKVKILLTSQPLAKIRELFNGMPCIEYDRERKGLPIPFFNQKLDLH
jgi:ankyrin repeat domain-containing protein 50